VHNKKEKHTHPLRVPTACNSPPIGLSYSFGRAEDCSSHACAAFHTHALQDLPSSMGYKGPCAGLAAAAAASVMTSHSSVTLLQRKT
jgi:hypothetical protein